MRERRCSRGTEMYSWRSSANVYGKPSVCQWFVKVVMCTEEAVWDQEQNSGVHHNGEWRDLSCNQKWILFAFCWSHKFERTKERDFCMPKVCSSLSRAGGGDPLSHRVFKLNRPSRPAALTPNNSDTLEV